MIDLVRTMVQKVNVPLHQAVQMATAKSGARDWDRQDEKASQSPIGADADLVDFIGPPDLQTS